ncbi:polysaccharide biosynthesis/export family protein [Allosediminivita pacifica]|uniref:Polysaccharide biosynthesis/export protein n=1 Tax=Allosediminivita pacifica TaxID=1267769 RepID=A0A2T6B5Q6_9RHOB|nr:polysaccharide biosynthesis/export family protein [Allosediminivita pacifica]PTX51387.1 polysaccharide biosynthesis/export protein [Allosediminivita pacifica]GGA99439.1 hypothetical protein GCM10011324_07080 [Allosediminivita pacifica]
MRTGIVLCIALSLVSACSTPRGAALRQEVLHEAKAETPTFEVVPVTRDNLPALAQWPVADKTGHYLWPKAQSGPASNTIRSGDSIDLVIWDSQENSLLTNPGEKFTRITDEMVAPDGSIFLPYVGKMKVSGLTHPIAHANRSSSGSRRSFPRRKSNSASNRVATTPSRRSVAWHRREATPCPRRITGSSG